MDVKSKPVAGRLRFGKSIVTIGKRTKATLGIGIGSRFRLGNLVEAHALADALELAGADRATGLETGLSFGDVNAIVYRFLNEQSVWVRVVLNLSDGTNEKVEGRWHEAYVLGRMIRHAADIDLGPVL